MTKLNNHILKKMMSNWLEKMDFTHFVTLAFNQNGHFSSNQALDYTRDRLKHFYALLDRRLLGPKWYKKPENHRTFFIAYPEKISFNIHYHLLVNIDDKHHNKFQQYGESIWAKTVRSGTYDCKILGNAPNPRGYISYVTKEQYKDINFNSFIISNEFH